MILTDKHLDLLRRALCLLNKEDDHDMSLTFREGTWRCEVHDLAGSGWTGVCDPCSMESDDPLLAVEQCYKKIEWYELEGIQYEPFGYEDPSRLLDRFGASDISQLGDIIGEKE